MAKTPLCKDCWTRHWYADKCKPGSPEAIRQRKHRELHRDEYNAYMREYRRK